MRTRCDYTTVSFFEGRNSCCGLYLGVQVPRFDQEETFDYMPLYPPEFPAEIELERGIHSRAVGWP